MENSPRNPQRSFRHELSDNQGEEFPTNDGSSTHSSGVRATFLKIGSYVADGKYKVVRLIGRGAVGEVYQVEQIFLGQYFALKVLRTGDASDAALRRFQLEAKAAHMLEHPNLVRAVDFGLIDGIHPFLVMDYVEGQTLSSLLKSQGSLPVAQAIEIFVSLCEAMDYAHSAGVIHRDLKPSNIVLVPASNGHKMIPKIVDFGIAKMEMVNTQNLTRTGEVFGTPLYMSPEQCSGEKVDRRSDIYALGCMLFEALTGAPPFCADTALRTMMLHTSQAPATLRDASLGLTMPDGLEQSVAKMLEKDPNKRYANCGEIAKELKLIGSGQYGKAEKEAAASELATKKIKSMSFSAAAIILFVGVTLIGATALKQMTLHKATANSSNSHKSQTSSSSSSSSSSPPADVGLRGQLSPTAPQPAQSPAHPASAPQSAQSLPTDQVKTASASPSTEATETTLLPDADAIASDRPKTRRRENVVVPAEDAAFKNFVEKRQAKYNSGIERDLVFTVPDECLSVSDKALSSLKKLPWLIVLSLNDCQYITDSGIVNVLESMNNVLRLDCDHTNVDGELLLPYLQKIYSHPGRILHQLRLSHDYITDKALLSLESDIHLKNLYLEGNEFSDHGLEGVARVQNLLCLDLRDCSRIGDDGIARLAKLPRLETLILRGTKISDNVVPILMKMKIASLDLSETEISNAALKSLSRLTSLKHLHIKNCDAISADGVARFRQAAPQCAVDY